MLSAPFRVVLDACVLYPMDLRDVLLQAAAEGLYQVYWSKQILDEATRNLVANLAVEDAKATRLVEVMSSAFPEARVIDYEHLIAAMRNDPKDRHVVAAAVKSGAQVIVTENTRDFLPLPEGIEAQTADEFLCNLFDLDPERMVLVLEKVCARRTKPPRKILPLVEATHCSELAKLVLEHVYSINAFRFWGEATDATTVLEFTYNNDIGVRVALPTSTLGQLEEELTSSLERNSLRRSDGRAGTGVELQSIRRPKIMGPEEEILALAVRQVSFHEAFDGESIVIQFIHSPEAATVVHLTNSGAGLLLQHVRNRLAFRA